MSILAPSSSAITTNAATRAALFHSITKPLPQWAHRLRPSRSSCSASRCSGAVHDADGDANAGPKDATTNTATTSSRAAAAQVIYPHHHQHQHQQQRQTLLQPSSSPAYQCRPPQALARPSPQLRDDNGTQPKSSGSTTIPPHNPHATHLQPGDGQSSPDTLPPPPSSPQIWHTLKRQTLSDAAIDEALAEFTATLGKGGLIADEHASALLALDDFLNSLPQRGRDASSWTQPETAIVWRLYQRSLDLHARSRSTPRPNRLALPVDHIISRLGRIMMTSRRLQHATRVPRILLDPRLRRSRIRFLFRRATWSIRVVSNNLCSHEQGSGAAALLEVWRRTVEALLDRGVLSIRSSSSLAEEGPTDSPGDQSSDQQALSYFLVLLAQFGSPECALRFASKLQRSGADAGFITSGDALKRTLEHLVSRGYCEEAASVFRLADVESRSIDCYALLIRHFGRADDGSPPKSGSPLPHASDFARKLWADALSCAEAQPLPTRSASFLQLFQARMHSHARFGDPVSVVRDVREMKRRKLLPPPDVAAHGKRRTSLSSLGYAAQMCAVVAHLKAGKWLNGKRLALMLIEDDRRAHPADSTETRLLYHQTALFNTLLSWARSSADAIPQDWRDTTRHTGLRLRREPSATATAMSFSQLETFRFRLHELIEAHHCKPDAITRNIVLQALLWWDKSSLSTAPGSDAMRDLLVQTGLFEWVQEAGQAAARVQGGGQAAARMELAYRDDPRGYLHRGQRLLESLARSFQASGFEEQAEWILAKLDEARRAARVETMKSRKEKYDELRRSREGDREPGRGWGR